LADTHTRQAKRTPVTLKIKFKSQTLDQFIERYSVDVSHGGIFIRTKDPLPVGTQMRFEFQLKDSTPLIRGDGTVVWTREHDPSRTGVAPGMGVRFDRLVDDSQEVLDKILAQKAAKSPRAKGPAFNEAPTKVAPSPLVAGLSKQSEPNLGNMAPPRASFQDERTDATPLPQPMPFHSDAEDFPEEAFEEATKVASLDALAAESLRSKEEEEELFAAAGGPLVDDPAMDDAPLSAPAAAPSKGASVDELAARRAAKEAAEKKAAEDKAAAAKEAAEKEAAAKEAAAKKAAEDKEAAAKKAAEDKAAAEKKAAEDKAAAEKKAKKKADKKSDKKAADVEAAELEKRAAAAAAAPKKKKSAGEHRATSSATDIPQRQTSGGGGGLIAAAVLLVGAAAFGGYWFLLRDDGKAQKKTADTAAPNTPTPTPPTPAPTPTPSNTGVTDPAPPENVDPPAKPPETYKTTLAAKPAGAMIELVGTDQKSKTPATFELEKGKTYTARITAPGFVAKEVSLAEGAKQKPVKLAAMKRVLRLTSEPEGAVVYIYGKQYTTPSDVELTGMLAKRKKLWLAFRKKGYKKLNIGVKTSASLFSENGDLMVQEVVGKLEARPVAAVKRPVARRVNRPKPKPKKVVKPKPKPKATAKVDKPKPKSDEPKPDKPKADKPKADKPKADKPKADKPKPKPVVPTGPKPSWAD
jgi:uncharacterized protein (TIGR02266 family)